MRISDWSSDVCSSDLGGSLAYVYLPGIAVDAREGWSPELKDRTMKSVIDHMSEFYEGFESEVGRFVETAREREKRLNVRSEEHTSELQSLMRISYAVFCLKKKKNNNKPQQKNILTYYNQNRS